jgi:4-aminobutyrate aminotransferase-like enzyme
LRLVYYSLASQLVIHWHTALIIPPLIITEEQLKEGFAVLDEALKITDAACRK